MSEAAPPSPGVSGVLRAADGHGVSAALRPLGLGFVDRALEVAYWTTSRGSARATSAGPSRS